MPEVREGGSGPRGQPLLCGSCRERLGVYEPVWQERDDGSRVLTSIAGLMHEAGDPARARLFHADCLTPLTPLTA
jgi:hypothetical protein